MQSTLSPRPHLAPSRLSALVLLCALSLSAGGGCTKSSAADKQATDTSGYTPITIKFADPGNYGVYAYAKREGILEKELAKVNAKIEWVPGAQAFSANFDAMNTGAINASGGAVSPVVGALAHNLPFKIFAMGDPSSARQAGIIAPKGSSIKTAKDLIGKRVAVNQTAKGDYILLKLLANNGIPADQVTRVPIQPPDAAAAFATGKIDAWATFGVFFSTAVRNGAHVLAFESQLQSDDVTITSANEEILKKNPAAFQVLLGVSQKLQAEARKHPEKFVNVFTDKGPTAVTGERLEFLLEEQRATPVQRVPNAEDRKRVENVARIFFENKSIDRELKVDNILFDIDGAAGSTKQGGAT